MANSHRRRNALKKIRINDSWFTEDYAIQKVVVDAFQNLLLDSGDGALSSRISLLTSLMRRILIELKESLLRMKS